MTYLIVGNDVYFVLSIYLTMTASLCRNYSSTFISSLLWIKLVSHANCDEQQANSNIKQQTNNSFQKRAIIDWITKFKFYGFWLQTILSLKQNYLMQTLETDNTSTDLHTNFNALHIAPFSLDFVIILIINYNN